MTTLISFHGDKKIKVGYLRRVERHRAADELVQGEGWRQNGTTRGCAVGCIFNAYDLPEGGTAHQLGTKEIGCPEWLMRLADTIHEGLPRDKAIGDGPKSCWPRRILDAIPVGVDVEPVKHRFCAWLMVGNIEPPG